MPGRCAAPPAPAMSTRRPRPAAALPNASISSAVRRADRTRVSWATSNSRNASDAPSMTGWSDELPIRTATSGPDPLIRPLPDAVGTPGEGGPEFPGGLPGPILRVGPAVSPHGDVPQLAARAGHLPVEVDVGAGERPTWPRAWSRGPTRRPARRRSPSRTWGATASVEPSGRSRTARTWFSNCDMCGGTLDRPVAAVVGPQGDFVDHQGGRPMRTARPPSPRSARRCRRSGSPAPGRRWRSPSSPGPAAPSLGTPRRPGSSRPPARPASRPSPGPPGPTTRSRWPRAPRRAGSPPSRRPGCTPRLPRRRWSPATPLRRRNRPGPPSTRAASRGTRRRPRPGRRRGVPDFGSISAWGTIGTPAAPSVARM